MALRLDTLARSISACFVRFRESLTIRKLAGRKRPKPLGLARHRMAHISEPYIGETVKTTGNGAGFIPYQLNGLPNQHELKVERKFEYGITGGLGMDISTKKGHHFIVEGRYFYGLSDMFGNSKKDPFARSANGTITAKVSYLFDIKKTNL